MDKEEYFRQLYALKESSDEEQDTNDAREVINQSAQPLSSSFPVPSQTAATRRTQQLGKSRKVPAIQRTASEPVTSSSIIRETPVVKKLSKTKPRYDVSSPPELAQSFSSLTPPTATSTSTSNPGLEQSASTPNLEYQPLLAMSHSTGIQSMLKRPGTRVDPRKAKKQRKEVPKLMPESEQVFAGKTLFFIPNDDIAPIRKARIAKAISFGAVWVKEWTPEITHIIVDKGYDFDVIMKLLKPMMNAETIPEHVALVNETYLPGCYENRTLVDDKQARYHVKGLPKPVEEKTRSLKPQPAVEKPTLKSRKNQETPDEGTQRSESESQPSPPVRADSTAAAPPIDDTGDHTGLVENPRERSPILDMDTTDNTELGEMIKFVQKFGDLPLEDDESEKEETVYDASQDFDPEHEGSSEEDLKPKAPKKRKSGKKTMDPTEYICMHGGTGKILDNTDNSKTIEILERMKDYYERVQDTWRIHAYRKAIGMLKRLPGKVSTFDEAVEIPGVGQRLAEKIEEIVLTGRLLRLENAETDPEDLVLQSFLKIYGVGLQQASKFIKAGYKTLDDLRTEARLTKGQKIGLDHYGDFNTRIPREEVTALGAIVKEAAKIIDPDVEAIIGGSYRRGAAISGDIDFILTKPGTSDSEDLLPFLYSLVDRLTKDGFLTAALATPSSSREDSGSKWHGAAVLPGNPIWRRIDFLLVPEVELGAALIYFTGDDIFNRSMRLLARHNGYGLNQRGLYKNVLRDKHGKKLNDGELVESRDERVIFQTLGVKWREPECRICH